MRMLVTVEFADAGAKTGARLNIRDWTRRKIHTLFGSVLLPSPRILSCACDGKPPRAVSSDQRVELPRRGNAAMFQNH
jgi:hypothetical protein